MKKMFCALLFVCNSVYACDEGTYADYPPCRFERVLIFQQPCPQQQEMQSTQQQSGHQMQSQPVQGTPVNSLAQPSQPQAQQAQQAIQRVPLDDERMRRLEETVNRLESTVTVLTNTIEKLTEYKSNQAQQMPEPRNDFKKKANSVPSLKNI